MGVGLEAEVAITHVKTIANPMRVVRAVNQGKGAIELEVGFEVSLASSS